VALTKTPDGKYTYESNDAAQVEAVAVLYEPDAKEKAVQLLKRAALARGETVEDEKAADKAEAKAATADAKADAKADAQAAKAESKAASKDTGNA
jgi:hypothetical protein